jgi:hypothetical protein
MSIAPDPLDAYTVDEIERAAGGETITRRPTPSGCRELCLVHLAYHEQGGVDCRDASRRDGATQTIADSGYEPGRRNPRSHWRKPSWQV